MESTTRFCAVPLARRIGAAPGGSRLTALIALLAALAGSPCRAEPAGGEAQESPGEKTRVPLLQQKLLTAQELTRKEQHAKALRAYQELIRSTVATTEERWHWYLRLGRLYLLNLQPEKAERVFRRVFDPDASPAFREVTIVTGSERRVEKVLDPAIPLQPPSSKEGSRRAHEKYTAALGLVRAAMERADYARAQRWLDQADSMHPQGCAVCDDLVQASHAALIQVSYALAEREPNVNVAFDRLHALIDGQCWLPVLVKLKASEAQRLVADEARLALAGLLLSIKDAPKAKTFFEAAATERSFAGELARSHLRKLTEVEKQPSERVPPGSTPPPTPSQPPPAAPDHPPVPLPPAAQ